MLDAAQYRLTPEARRTTKTNVTIIESAIVAVVTLLTADFGARAKSPPQAPIEVTLSGSAFSQRILA
ncbi:MAG: hypothetical protein ACRENP_08930 [Longimicrobiales bacterium]